MSMKPITPKHKDYSKEPWLDAEKMLANMLLFISGGVFVLTIDFIMRLK